MMMNWALHALPGPFGLCSSPSTLHSRPQSLYNNGMNEQTTALPPARLGRALAKGFRAAYDSLGYVVGASFATFVACALLLSLASLAVRHSKSPVALLLILPTLLVAWLAGIG